MATEWLTAEQAAARLGVKTETLYAYVSRGLIRRERKPGERRSQYARGDVERLAARHRSGGRAGALEIIIETELTQLDLAGHLYYRGWDVAQAAEEATFEEVATWLWTGTREPLPFEAPGASLAVARKVSSAMAPAPPIDGARGIVTALRTLDPLRDDRRAEAVAHAGRAMIATIVEALPIVDGNRTSADPSIAARLWPRLSPRRPSPDRVRTLDAALVLLADHELAASTLAARVAASTWADPYLVVQAGLAALGGPLHGGASTAARALIAEVRAGEATAAEAVGSRLRAGVHVPGFGHSVYVSGDPRARALLRMLGGGRSSNVVGVVREVIDTMDRRNLPFPNIDLATAALAEANDMIPGATELLFAVARIAGWLAHATEEYAYRLRFRPRAAYIGPAPTAAEDHGVAGRPRARAGPNQRRRRGGARSS